MRSGRTIAALLAGAIMSAVPAASTFAQDAHAPTPGPAKPLSATEQTIVDTLTRAMSFLSRTFDKVVIYELPEVLPNGDIIIRRKHPKPEPNKAPPPESGKIQL
jgi:hypothetical protein